MTMKALITISSFVPLIKGLFSLDSISIRVLAFTFTSFAFHFRKEKHVKEKKQSVQDLIPGDEISQENNLHQRGQGPTGKSFAFSLRNQYQTSQ